MTATVTTLSLAALAGAAALFPFMRAGGRVTEEMAARVERLCRWVGLPLLAALTLYVSSRLYTPIYLALLATRAGIITVAFAAMCWGLGYHVAAVLVFLALLPWEFLPGSAIAVSALTVALVVRRRGLAHHLAAAMVIVSLLGSEGILASAAADGFGSRHPDWCAMIGGRRAQPIVLSILRSGRADTSVAEDAARELLRVGDRDQPSVLTAALVAGDESTAEEATQELVRLGSAAVPVLVATLADASSTAADAVARALVRIGAPAVPALLREITADERATATGVGSVMGEYVAAFDERRTAARGRAAEALGQIGDRRAVLPLIDLLSGSGDAPGLSRTGALALGAIGDPRALPSLLAVMRAENADAELRETAAWAVGKIGGARTLPDLMAALKDPNGHVRNGAAWGLAEMGTDVVPVLIAGLKERLARPGRNLGDGDWIAWALGLMRARGAREVLLEADRRAHYGRHPCVFCEALQRLRGE